jgi:Cohesin domain
MSIWNESPRAGLRKSRAATKLAGCMSPRNRILAYVVVAGAAAAAAAVLLPEAPPPADVVQPVRPDARNESKPEQGRFAALPEREGIGRQKGELFGSRDWAPPPAPRKQAAAKPEAEAPPPPPPAPPPMPYRVAGQVVHDGSAQVVLAKGDRVVTVREGQQLEDGYRVESIRGDGVTLVYIPLDARQHIPAATALALAEPPPAKAAEQTAAAADTRPAQLRWEGPERVQAGNTFNVALKLTSHQPVRATPLQLSFDDKLLEPVAVRPGGFFAPGSFSYRVNPGGSIFVGGFGRGTTSADAEFVVVTFKPIRSGTTAELKLSSVVLQGAAGRAIAHEPLAAFRTTVQ